MKKTCHACRGRGQVNVAPICHREGPYGTWYKEAQRAVCSRCLGKGYIKKKVKKDKTNSSQKTEL